ncbi:ferredoxin [Nocardioides sp. AE5]|uniref:ferredoxin n=1 Tax=Nocardioides sp. AE5 TaxID=2962573 RepID=UPI0028817936|nr:ferredoxin [Nocardioides sp. AE5]MDT0200468.1 ferredoxin [Nocardioides sp. AE5]
MKVVVDRTLCISNGLCVAIAPRVFDLDDQGSLVVMVEEGVELPEQLAEEKRALHEAAASCPVGAIKIQEGDK